MSRTVLVDKGTDFDNSIVSRFTVHSSCGSEMSRVTRFNRLGLNKILAALVLDPRASGRSKVASQALVVPLVPSNSMANISVWLRCHCGRKWAQISAPDQLPSSAPGGGVGNPSAS